jgi:hypothetical protein
MDQLSTIQQEQLDRVNEIIAYKLSHGYDAFNQATGGKSVPHPQVNMRVNPFSAKFLEQQQRDLLKQKEMIQKQSKDYDDRHADELPEELQGVNDFEHLSKQYAKQHKKQQAVYSTYKSSPEYATKEALKQELKENKDYLQVVYDKLEPMINDIKGLKEEIKERDRLIKKFMKNIGRLDEAKDHVQELHNQIERIRDNIHGYEEAMIAIEQEKAEIEPHAEGNETILEEVVKLDRKIGILEDTIAKLNEQGQRLDRERHQLGSPDDLDKENMALISAIRNQEHNKALDVNKLRLFEGELVETREKEGVPLILSNISSLQHKIDNLKHKKKNIRRDIKVSETLATTHKKLAKMKPRTKERKIRSIEQDIRLLKARKQAIKAPKKGGVRAGVSAGKGKEMTWQAHLKACRAEHPDMPYKKVQAMASKSYKQPMSKRSSKVMMKKKGGVRAGKKKTMSHHQNPWIMHVQAYRKKHPSLSYKEVLMEARKSYKK